MRYYLDQPPSEVKFASTSGRRPASITLPATADWLHRIDWILWAFDDKVDPGYIRVRDVTNNATLLEVKITDQNYKKAYHDFWLFGPEGFICPTDAEIKIELDSGGDGVDKTLTIQHR